jgi:hypothetical protein
MLGQQGLDIAHTLPVDGRERLVQDPQARLGNQQP